MAAIPVIRRCIQARPIVNILMTTSTVTAHSLLEKCLPPGVLLQFAPVDTPLAVERFLSHWHPQAAIFMESELWPNLLLASALKGMPLALLNARMSAKSFERWSLPPARSLVAAMLLQFSLITPLSTKEAVRFQILGASPLVIHFAGNLKYACGAGDANKKFGLSLELKNALVGRQIWLAASTHVEEEEAIIRIHQNLSNWLPSLLTIIAPRHPARGHSIRTQLQQQGFDVAQRSQGDPVLTSTDVYIADTLGELKEFYSLAPVAFVGGSLVKGLSGHNLAEAAAAGCVVLTGHYIGHFQEMLLELQKIAPLSVQQVDGEQELLHVLHNLLGKGASLRPRRDAAQFAFAAAADGVVLRVWNVLNSVILDQTFGRAASDASQWLEEDKAFVG